MSRRLAALDDAGLEAALMQCGLPASVAAAVLTHAPFDDDAALGREVDAAVLGMSAAELQEALRAEPAPRTETGDADALEAAELAMRLYEGRFGYPYVSSIGAPTAEELLMRVRIRLGNDIEPEGRATREHFRRIVHVRLGGPGAESAAR